MQTCASITKTGAPCRAPAGPGGLCFFHAHPEKAQVLGQVGGRKNRQQLPEPPIGPFSATEIRNILAESIFGVRSKTLTPRAASAIAQLCNSMKSMLATAELEDRVARLEQQLAEQHRDSADPREAETVGNTVADEEAAEQLVEEEPSTLPDAGQPVEGSEDGVEDRGYGIADEGED